MKIREAMEDERPNTIAFQHLKPREKLIWAGKERLKGLNYAGLVFIWPALILLVWQWIFVRASISVVVLMALCVLLSIYILAVKARKKVVLAITDRRIMIIYPRRSIRWFWTNDVKAICPSIDSDGSGSIKFQFNRPVQAQVKILDDFNQSHVVVGSLGNEAVTEFCFSGIEDAQALAKLQLTQIKGNGEERPKLTSR